MILLLRFVKRWKIVTEYDGSKVSLDDYVVILKYPEDKINWMFRKLRIQPRIKNIYFGQPENNSPGKLTDSCGLWTFYHFVKSGIKRI